jgi:predicted Zn-dependent peptidase
MLPLGSATDPVGQAGRQQLLAGSLSRGCGQLEAEKFADLVEGLGANLRSDASEDLLVLALKCASSDGAQLLPLLLTMLEQPLFNSDQVRRERDLNLQTLQRLQEDPFHRCHDGLLPLLYGHGPYGHDPLGRASELAQLEAVHLQSDSAQLMRSDAVLVISGDPNERMFDSLQERFQHWQAPAFAVPEPLPPGDQTFATNPIETEQMVLMLGFRTLPVQHRDFLSLRLLQIHLGVGMSSRLFQCLREERAIVYDIGVEFAGRQQGSPMLWHLSTSADQGEDALTALHHEWQRLLNEPLSLQELSLAKAKWRGHEALAQQTGSQRAQRLALHICQGLGENHAADQQQLMDQLGSQDLLIAARRWLSSPRLSCCGPQRNLIRLAALWQQFPARKSIPQDQPELTETCRDGSALPVAARER